MLNIREIWKREKGRYLVINSGFTIVKGERRHLPLGVGNIFFNFVELG